MARDDFSDSPQAESPPRTRRAGRLWYAAAGFGVVFLGGSLLLWFLRKPVAEQALSAWCAERGLDCDANFTELGTRGITLSALRVASGSQVPAEAAEVRAGLRWKGLFTPEVTGVTVNGLSIRGTLDDGGLQFGGLERLIPSGGGGGPAPAVDIRDARLLLDTPAGPAAATVNVTGVLPQNGVITIRLDQGTLEREGARAEIGEGRLDVRIENGVANAELGLRLPEVSSTDYRADTFDLVARAGLSLDASKPAALEWSLRAASFSTPTLEASDLSTTGQVALRGWPGVTPESLLAELEAAVFEADAARLSHSGREVIDFHAEGQLAGEEDIATGPVMITTGAIAAPEGSAAAVTLGGDVQAGRETGFAFDGALSANGAGLSEDLRGQVEEMFFLPGILDGHADALSRALSRGLTTFDATVGVGVSVQDGTLALSGTGDSAIEAASGLSLRVRSVDGQPWVTLRRGDISASGNVALSGGGAPSASLALRGFSYRPEEMSLAADAFLLSDWTVGGRMISAAMSDVHLASRTDNIQFGGRGEFEFAGEAGGVTFQPTRITGGVDGARNASGWRMQASGAPCFAVDTGGLKLGAIMLAPAHLDLCPVNGRFMREGPVPSGAANLGAVRLPFSIDSGGGVLNLSGAKVDWAFDKAFTLSVDADELSLPLTLGERTLTIDSAAPGLGIRTGRGPAAIEAHLGATVFGGSMVPANVTASEFVFDGVSAPAGIDGRVSARNVGITDLRKDAMYEPLLAEFSGTLSGRQLNLTGPVALRASRVPIADAVLDLDIVELDGTAKVTTRNIAFGLGGLQPSMISDRLTGLFTRATGNVDGVADFTISDGKVAGTARGEVRYFGFQTTQLGRVTGLAGKIYFDDLMALTTPSGQVFTLESVNPGIPLTEGRIEFGLKEGGVLGLETVTFPFGGGKLEIAPFDWKLESGFESQVVEVNAKSIDLARLIEILKLPDTRATGTVSGVFPIAFSGSSVAIRNARLTADDPGGNLSYTGGAAGAAAGEDASANLAFEALRDLQFNVLEVGITGDLAGQVQADLLIAGRNVNPLPMGPKLTLPAGQPFEFSIGFDVPLGKLLEENLGVLTQEDLIDATRDLLDAEKKNGAKPE